MYDIYKPIHIYIYILYIDIYIYIYTCTHFYSKLKACLELHTTVVFTGVPNGLLGCMQDFPMNSPLDNWTPYWTARLLTGLPYRTPGLHTGLWDSQLMG